MKHDPGLQEVGGHAYLMGLAAAAPASPEIGALAHILHEFAQRRALIRLGEELVSASYEAPRERPAKVIAQEATEALMRVDGAMRLPPIKPYEAGLVVLEQAERALRGERKHGILTGFGKLDEVTGGLFGGEHVIVPGRSGMGKSGLLISMGLTAALAGHPVKAFNMDMRSVGWVQRTLCELEWKMHPEERPIWHSKFRRGTLSNIEIGRLAEANRLLQDLPYEICDEGSMTLGAIVTQSRAFVSKHKGCLGMILVDFLQRVKPDERGRNRSEESEISDAAYGMRELAKQTDWVVTSAAQLKNKNTNPSTKQGELPPTAEDIRGSGAIEMAGDIIFSPYRKAFFIQQREPDKVTDPVRWGEWRAELTEAEHNLRLLGFKFRDSSAIDLSGTYWCDMGSNSFRDERPIPASIATDEAARQLAMGLDGGR